MTVGLSRKLDGPELCLEHFRSYTVAHPRLVEAKETLMNAIKGAEPNSLIFVFGPTGVGKTTLRLKIEQLIASELLRELREDLTRVPVVSVEAVAPESGSFKRLRDLCCASFPRPEPSAPNSVTQWSRLSDIAGLLRS